MEFYKTELLKLLQGQKCKVALYVVPINDCNASGRESIPIPEKHSKLVFVENCLCARLIVYI